MAHRQTKLVHQALNSKSVTVKPVFKASTQLFLPPSPVMRSGFYEFLPLTYYLLVVATCACIFPRFCCVALQLTMNRAELRGKWQFPESRTVCRDRRYCRPACRESHFICRHGNRLVGPAAFLSTVRSCVITVFPSNFHNSGSRYIKRPRICLSAHYLGNQPNNC